MSHDVSHDTGAGNKSATGLMEWIDVDTSLDAFVLANHQTVYSESEFTLALFKRPQLVLVF